MVVAIVVFMHPKEPQVYERFSPKKVYKKKKKTVESHELPNVAYATTSQLLKLE